MALAGASANTDVEPAFSGVSIDSGGYGILDCDYRTPQGGVGRRELEAPVLSVDGGVSTKFDASADRIPGNLYTVKFFDDKTGFALGSDGRPMRYQWLGWRPGLDFGGGAAAAFVCIWSGEIVREALLHLGVKKFIFSFVDIDVPP